MYVPSLVPSVDPAENYVVQNRVWFDCPVQMAPGLVLKRGDRVIWHDDGLSYRGWVICCSPEYTRKYFYAAVARVWLARAYEVLAFASELEFVE